MIIGSKQIGLSLLKLACSISADKIAGILTIDDSSDTRSELAQIRDFSTKNNIPFYIAGNRSESEKIITQIQPNICFVAGWYYILSEKILNSVPNGFVGIHHSLLPKYRGGSPLVWSIINGDTFSGTSIFKFTPGMDDGPIYARQKVEIFKTDYISEVLDKANNSALELLSQNFNSIINGTLHPQLQNLNESTFCALRLPEDGLINWNWSSEKIYNFIRAQAPPYPGAFTLFEGEKLSILKAQPLDIVFYGTPGQVVSSCTNGVQVVCGDNTSLLLLDISFKGNVLASSQVIKSITTRLK